MIAVAAGLSTVPVWIPTFPPMTDLPQHASQIALLRNMTSGGFPYEHDFTLAWFTPYLLGYLLGYVLTPAVGIVVACKIMISLALIALPVMTALLLIESNEEPRWALLTIPSLYGFSYQWGLFNFLLAVPVGQLLLWLVIRQAARPSRSRWFGIVVTVNVLFFCHALACVFFGAIAAAIVLTNSSERPLKSVAALATVAPSMLAWGVHATANPTSLTTVATRLDFDWVKATDGYYSILAGWAAGGTGWGRLTGFFPRLLGARPGWLPVCFGTAILALPFIAGARLSTRPGAWIPFVACVLTLMFMPSSLFGIAYTYQRFSLLVVPCFLLTLRQIRPTWPRWTWPLTVAMAASWVVISGRAAVAYERDARGFERLLDRMRPQARVLTLAFDRDSAGMIAPPFLHFPAWYAATKRGVVDPSTAGTFVVPVQYRRESEPAAHVTGFEWHPETFEWETYNGRAYRYFVVISEIDRSAGLFSSAPCHPQLVDHIGRWWLYDNDRACASREP